MEVQYLQRKDKVRLAYVYSPPDGAGAEYPLVMFCGGFKSNMNGTKATHFEETCRARGQAYLRFDYTGHGFSEGRFEDGTIGCWYQDALDVLDHVATGPVVIVGSSMGGWIALLVALARPEMVHGLIGIAAAPDFTDEYYAKNLTDEQRAEIESTGQAVIPNSYDPDDPFIIRKELITEARQHFLLHEIHEIAFPVCLIQGMKDPDVPWETAPKIQKALTGSEVDLIFVDDGDHSLSRPQDLTLIDREIRGMSGISG